MSEIAVNTHSRRRTPQEDASMISRSLFLVTLSALLCPHLALADFEARLLAALHASPLSPAEKVQHVLNRLGYGPNATTFRASRLLIKTGVEYDAARTDAAIARYVATMLETSANVPGAIARQTAAHYPVASL